jgi:cell wall assembly regulator SMI1
MIEPGPSCSDEQLARAEAALGVPLPGRIRELFRAGDGRYRRHGDWWVVWPLDRLVADNTDAWRRGTLSRALLAFGDDGTGNPFCVPIGGIDEVLRWSWIDSATDANEGTLAAFLA